LAQGITAMKIWPFDEFAGITGGNSIAPKDLDKGLEPFRRIRDQVGQQMDVLVELHGLWSLPAAVRIAEALRDFNPVWIEDPIKLINPDALATFARRSAVPVGAGETLATTAAYLDLLQRSAVDYVIIDLSWCGGLTEAKRICSLAQTYQRPVAPHDCTGPVSFVAGLHLALNARNAVFQESVRAFYRGWYKDVVTVLPSLTDGAFGPIGGPGLGTELRGSFLSRPDLVRRVTSLGST
jgi:L-alanine-DL-glutamate epimerase-like enolase superfamily enzyme